MPIENTPTWDETTPETEQSITPPSSPSAPPAASGEPSWEDTTPDVAPSPLPDFKIKLTPEKGLLEPGMGAITGPDTPEDKAMALRALPQALEIPFAVLGKTVAAGARTVRDVLNPMTYLPPDQRPRPNIITPTEIRPMTDEEIATRDPLQQGKPIFQFPRTELQPESGEGQRMIEGLLTPENLALLPEAGGRAGAAALLAATVPGLVQQITQVVSGKGTEEQKRDAVNSLLIPALLMTRAHAFPGGRAVTTPGDLTEGMQVPPPITLTGGEIPGRPKGAPAPIVPPVEIARATPEQAAAAASRMQRTATAAFEPRVGPPEVPITPAEPREDVISTIRKAGARTRGEIQKLFPGRELSREEAGQLRDQAWPADVDERAIQQAEATRQANAAAEQARRARIMAPATAPAPPRAAEPAPQPAAPATTGPNYVYNSPESKAWHEEADRLQKAFAATEPHSPERKAARAAMKAHDELAYGPNGNPKLAGRRIDANNPLKQVGDVRESQHSLTNLVATDLTGWKFDGDWQLSEDEGRQFRKVKSPDGKETRIVWRDNLHPLELQALEKNTVSKVAKTPKIEELIKTKPGDITAQTIAALSDEDAGKLFAANAERGTATQHDAVLAGIKLNPADVSELQRMRDEAQKKALEAASTGDNTAFLSNMGKVVWFNGAMEGALRKGPNFDLVMEREAAKAPKEEEQVTLYHGEGAQGGGGSDTRLFTKHPERAATYGPDVYTVTVPKSVADAAAAAAKKEGTGTTGDYVLPQEWVKKAEKMPSPPKQVVHEIPTGEEPPAAPAAPPAARTPIPRLRDDQIRKLRLLGLSNREISDIQTGKPVNQVVIDKLPVDLTRGEDHAAANEEARQQAVKDINKIISPSPAAPEAKYLGKPISYWEGIIENLPKGTERERLARSLGVANQPSKIIQYLRKRINDMRAAGVKPAKISFAAYIPPGQTRPEVGANHPEILKRLGIPGFETPESRNTPQFGFTDEEGNFLTREQAAERAKLTGQDLKEFEPGEPAHSDEIASPTEPTKPISEAKTPPAAPGELISVPPAENVNAQRNAIVSLLQQLEEENPRGELVAKDIDIPELDKLVKPIADVLHEDMGKLAEENSAGLVKLLRNRLHEMEAAKATGQPVPELPPAPKQQPNLGSARVARAWNLWNEDPNATTRDLLETIEGYIEDHPQDIPEGLQKAAQAYREAIEEDYELKGRGETEPAADAFESEVSKIAGEGAIKPESYPVRTATKPAKPATKLPPAAPITPKVSMGPGAAARAEFEEGPPSIEAAGVDRLEMPAWDLAMAKYRNLKEGIAQLFTRRTTKADFSLISNAIYNIPRYFGQIAAKSLRLRANDVERRAVTFLMQALKMSGDGLSADDAERLGQLEHAGDPIGYLKTRGFDMKTAAEQFRNQGKNLNAAAAEQSAQAMALALEKYNQLLPIARRARRQFDAQLTREANAGIDTEYENWYVPQRHDLDLMPTANRPIVLGDPRGGGSQAFQKAKVFEDYATAIEKGFVPRSLDIADLLEHRVNQGERMVQKKIFFDKLANYKDPVDGNPLVTKIPKRVIKRPDGDIRVQEHIPRGYEAIEPMPGIRLAVHKGYARLVRALTGNSQIGESALVGALQDLAAVEKHLGLALDTFHASRTLQAELALTGRVSIGPRLKRGLALVEYHPRDLDLAVKQGLITQEMADWVTTRNPMQLGGRELELSPYQIVNIGARNGLQMARVADVMYREWTRQIPISGAVNKWVFDKMTRSAISQAFVLEFERVAKNNPHLNANGVGRMVAREINTFFGNIGKEGIFKNPSLSTLNQIIWLAPKWVEALATREARAAKQLGEIPFKIARGEHITIPTTLKGIGTGLGAYFVATQLLNLFTRHQFTFQNQEEGHKLDAWIPDVTGKTRGFFISPLSVFGEITHDIIRYAREKPDFITAVAAILGNKLGNLARAGEILVSGRDPVSGEKLLGSARRALTAAVQLVPAPISLSQVGRGIGHELFPGAVPAPAPGAVQRQLTSTIGFKTEPAGSAQQQVFNMVDAWKRSSPNHKIRYQLEQRQKQDFGPSDYRDMRNALIRGDLSQASRAYDKLLENRTPKDIRQTLEHPHPFTGSKQYERAFVSSLTPEQRQTYQAAIQERRALARTFEDMLRQRYANQRQVGAPSALSP